MFRTASTRSPHARGMPRSKPLPSALGDAFTVARAREAGVSRSRTRGRDLAMPFRGVRVRAAPSNHRELCWAYLPRLRDGQFFTHLSAAVLWGMPLSRTLEQKGPVHIGALAPAQPPRAAGVDGHVLPPGVTIRASGGVPLLSPAETWSFLGTVLTHVELVVAGDFLLRRKRPLATLAQLQLVVTAKRRPGIPAVRLALADVRAKTDSPKESELRLAITAAGLPEPVVGHTITNDLGDFIATPDLAYVAERIAIEYEGTIHFNDPRVYVDDIARYELMAEAGWLVIRVVARDLGYRREILIARIERALAGRGPLRS